MVDRKIRHRPRAHVGVTASTTATSALTTDLALTPWLICMSQILLGVAVYAFTADLPFFWDDLPQNAWLAQTSLAGVWSATVPGLNYFRPIAFSVWKLIALAQGEFDPVALHMLNVVLHIANATLVGLIACRLATTRKTLTGIAAASVFMLFPFSVQAIAPVNSLMHPLHALLILMAVWLYLRSATFGAPRLASIVLAGVAILAHENGVIACALVTWTALCVVRPLSLQRTLRDVGPYWLACVLGFLVWRAAPRLADPLPLDTVFGQLAARLQNGALFLQGFAFLFTPLANPLKSTFGPVNDVIIVTGIALVVAVAWLALFGIDRRLMWAAGWFVVAALPAVALLDFAYIVESPRLLYLASAGIALFWALPLGLLPRTNRTAVKRVWLGVASVVVLASAVWGWVYIGKRGALYEQLAQSVAQLHAATDAQDTRECANSDETWLAVNFPDWFFVAPVEYVLGHDGITLLPEGSTLDALMRGNFAQQQNRFVAVVLPDILRDGAPFKPMGPTTTQASLQTQARTARGVIINHSDNAHIRVENAGCQLHLQNTSAAQARFENTLHLVRASFVADRANPRRAVLTLDWHTSATPTTDVTVFVQVLDASGQLVAQADGFPLGGTSPMRLWQMDDAWRDLRVIALPANVSPGTYRVVVGVYQTGGGQRLTATHADGRTFDDNAVPVAMWTLVR